MEQIVILVDAPARYVSRWVMEHTGFLFLEKFVDGAYKIELNTVLKRDPEQDEYATIEFDACEWPELGVEGTGEEFEAPMLISFVPLTTGRVEVTAYCFFDYCRPYLLELLKAMTRRWPEALIQVSESSPKLAQDLGALASATDKELPWQQVPEGRDREIARLWWENCTSGEIARKVGLITSKTVLNRVCELRATHGEQAIPYRRRGKAG